MSLRTPTVGSASGQFAIPPVPTRRWSVDEYHAMIRAGILTDGDPIELLDGWLVAKMTKNPPHRIATRRVRKALERVAPPGWYVDSQEPITLPSSEPEPDGLVIRGDTSDYADRHPGAADVALVVEVADASLEFDRTVKKAIYAQAGIPVYWIVNLIDGRLEVYTGPETGTGALHPAQGREPTPNIREPVPVSGQPLHYRECREYTRGDEVPLLVEGREAARVAVRELFP